MYIGRATAGLVAPAGVVVEAVGAEIIPAEGEGFILTAAQNTWDGFDGGQASLFLQESLNAGALYTTIYTQILRAAGTLGMSDQRALAVSPSGARQAPGSQNLRYRMAMQTPGGVDNIVSGNIVGRTEK